MYIFHVAACNGKYTHLRVRATELGVGQVNREQNAKIKLHTLLSLDSEAKAIGGFTSGKTSFLYQFVPTDDMERS